MKWIRWCLAEMSCMTTDNWVRRHHLTYRLFWEGTSKLKCRPINSNSHNPLIEHANELTCYLIRRLTGCVGKDRSIKTDMAGISLHQTRHWHNLHCWVYWTSGVIKWQNVIRKRIPREIRCHKSTVIHRTWYVQCISLTYSVCRLWHTNFLVCKTHTTL